MAGPGVTFCVEASAERSSMGLDNDVLIGGREGDRLDGGTGIDIASYEDAGMGVTADLSDSSKNTGDGGG
jgi:hypothetical protein